MSGQNKKILVIGGGISGMTAAIEAAEVGYETVLVEKEPYLGGRVARMFQYFPKMCPPPCGLEINFKRIRNNPRIKVYTMAEVDSVSGEPGSYQVKIKIRPRYVTGKKPLSKAHFDAVKSEVENDFDYGMSKRKALALPHPMAFPYLHVLNKEALTPEEISALESAEPKGAIELGQEEEVVELEAGAIILATGWRPFDPARMPDLNFGKIKDVITNVMMERLAAANGPTQGQILKPSDQQPPQKVAFVQCVGSRDENHLPYCSGVCCMASLKQARYVRSKLPDAEIKIFYIDIRPISRLEKFYYDLLGDDKIEFIKGKVPKITQDGEGRPVLHVEEMLKLRKMEEAFDLVVLAAGVVPVTADWKLKGASASYDENGFVLDSPEAGILGAGCAKRPLDVSRSVKDATAAALKAIQAVKR